MSLKHPELGYLKIAEVAGVGSPGWIGLPRFSRTPFKDVVAGPRGASFTIFFLNCNSSSKIILILNANEDGPIKLSTEAKWSLLKPPVATSTKWEHRNFLNFDLSGVTSKIENLPTTFNMRSVP